MPPKGNMLSHSEESSCDDTDVNSNNNNNNGNEHCYQQQQQQQQQQQEEEDEDDDLEQNVESGSCLEEEEEEGEIVLDLRERDEQLNRMKSFYAEHCVYLPAMIGWFFFSAGLTTYNKTVFGKTHGHFPCPLLMTCVHFLTQWLFAHVVSELFPETMGTDVIHKMTWKEWFSTSVPCGLVTSADVGLSNMAMVYISMTFATMIKSSAPIFVLTWAYIFGIEKITKSLVLVVVIIATGELLTVAGEVDFHPLGFGLCFTAAVLSGARWTLVQLKLSKMEPPLKSTIVTMRLLSPSMFWSLLAVSMIIERPWIRLADRSMSQNLFDLFGLGMMGATIAISMILCEFYLLLKSNAIVLMIGGVIKEMIVIIVGVLHFGDELNDINVSGCIVVFIGVFYYKYTHYMQKKQQQIEDELIQEQQQQQQQEQDEEELGGSDGSNQNVELPAGSSNENRHSNMRRAPKGGGAKYSQVTADSEHGLEEEGAEENQAEIDALFIKEQQSKGSSRRRSRDDREEISSLQTSDNHHHNIC